MGRLVEPSRVVAPRTCDLLAPGPLIAAACISVLIRPPRFPISAAHAVLAACCLARKGRIGTSV
jgi:hypothetical protein